jgi:chromosome segregation ATPase
MNTESLILTAIAVISAIGSLLSLRSNNKRTDTESKKLEDEITERVLVRADKEIDKMQRQLDAEIKSRAADKVAYEAEIEKLRMEVHSERSARGMLESKLIASERLQAESMQRISALEDERDRYVMEIARKDARIRDLESNRFGPVA